MGGNGVGRLVMQDDGNLVQYNGDNSVAWAAGSNAVSSFSSKSVF